MNRSRFDAQVNKLIARTAERVYAASDDTALDALAHRLHSDAPVKASEWLSAIGRTFLRIARVDRARSVRRRARR